MLKYKLLAMLLITLLSVTVSCGSVTVKDKQVCADLGIAGAECAHTLITNRQPLTKTQWDKQRVGWMCMSSGDFSDSEDSIDELCKTTSLCGYETQDQIAQVKDKMSPLLQKGKAAMKH